MKNDFGSFDFTATFSLDAGIWTVPVMCDVNWDGFAERWSLISGAAVEGKAAD